MVKLDGAGNGIRCSPQAHCVESPDGPHNRDKLSTCRERKGLVELPRNTAINSTNRSCVAQTEAPLRSRLNFAQKTCVAAAGKLMQQTEHIKPHARIGIAVSGGMDSFVLLQVLRHRQRIVPFPFEIMALHINPGFEPTNHTPLTRWAGRNGISLHSETSTMGPDAHSSKNRKKSPCFYCSWFRRKRLFDLSSQYGLTHLALGHNREDLVSTFLMNLIQTGKVEGMAGKASYFGGTLQLIRPLLLVEKKFIRKAAEAWQLPTWKNPCPSSATSARKQSLLWLNKALEHDRKRLQNVSNAISRWQLDLDRNIQ